MCTVEELFDDMGAFASRLLLFWIVVVIDDIGGGGGGGWFRVTMGREFGVSVCSGRGGATGGGADPLCDATPIVMRLAPPGGKG